MDINVKRDLDYLLEICGSITTEDGKSFEEILAKDIHDFINSITKADSNVVFDYFSKLYLDGRYKAQDFDDRSITDYPESLKLLVSKESESNRKTEAKVSKHIARFFTTLGRYYMTSKYDRKRIDTSRFIDLINDYNSYIDDNGPKKVTKQEASGTNANMVVVSYSDTQTDIVETEEEVSCEEPEETLEVLLEQLDSLIGLQEVKKEVAGIINMIKVKKRGEELGVKQQPLSLHLVFYGNPGTGKTTVARLLAKIYRCLGVLSSGQIIEVDRGGLVAGHIGGTAEKTNKVIEKAMGGILFIDEAYSLTHGKGETDFGQEAVDTILKAMEDNRDDFIVIVAGYPDLMKEFVSSNPGLKSRFNQYIYFSDYSPLELYQIFCLFCRKQELSFNEDCTEYLKSYFENIYTNRSEDFANGRNVRNYFENVLRARANRLADSNLEEMSREQYLTLTMSDLQVAADSTKSI